MNASHEKPETTEESASEAQEGTAHGSDSATSGSVTDEKRLAWQLESRIARLEGEVRALADRFDEIQIGERNRKQRALWVRLVLLLVLLGGFFVMQARGGL